MPLTWQWCLSLLQLLNLKELIVFPGMHALTVQSIFFTYKEYTM